MSFYRSGNRLLLELNVSDGNTVSVEIEREVDGEVRQNPEAYARFGKEIAEYKAGRAPSAEPVKPAAPAKAKAKKRGK